MKLSFVSGIVCGVTLSRSTALRVSTWKGGQPKDVLKRKTEKFLLKEGYIADPKNEDEWDAVSMIRKVLKTHHQTGG